MEESKEVTLFYSVDNSEVFTKACIELCSQVMKRLYATVDKVPFDIRAMLRIIVSSIDGAFNEKTKIIEEKAAYLMADLLAGCWLNGGFRWQECFGMTLTLKHKVI